MTTGYYLLDSPRRGPTKWYPSRRSPVRVIVLHITAGLEGIASTDDQSAEATARYAANTDRAVSWHAGCDTDSVLRLLPPSYTAFHCQGYNSSTLGLEISKKTTRWQEMPAEWVRRTLDNAAVAVRPWMAEFGIPPRLLTRSEVDAGAYGFSHHALVDPTRRSDPGPDFPWDSFAARLTPTPPEDDDMPKPTDYTSSCVDPVSGGVWGQTAEGGIATWNGAPFRKNYKDYIAQVGPRTFLALVPNGQGGFIQIATDGTRWDSKDWT